MSLASSGIQRCGTYANRQLFDRGKQATHQRQRMITASSDRSYVVLDRDYSCPHQTKEELRMIVRRNPAFCLMMATSLFKAGWSLQPQSRARFLSSSAGAFLASTAAIATNPQECQAAGKSPNENPRYIDQELQMKYADGPGKLYISCSV